MIFTSIHDLFPGWITFVDTDQRVPADDPLGPIDHGTWTHVLGYCEVAGGRMARGYTLTPPIY